METEKDLTVNNPTLIPLPHKTSKRHRVLPVAMEEGYGFLRIRNAKTSGRGGMQG